MWNHQRSQGNNANIAKQSMALEADTTVHQQELEIFQSKAASNEDLNKNTKSCSLHVTIPCCGTVGEGRFAAVLNTSYDTSSNS